MILDVTISSCGRWNYLYRTYTCLRRMVPRAVELCVHVADDAGYDFEAEPRTRRKIKQHTGKGKWFHDYFFPDIQDYSVCMEWLFNSVRSDVFYHTQDDWVFLKPVDLCSIVKILRTHGDINQVRFNKRSRPLGHRDPDYLKCFNMCAVRHEGTDLLRTIRWAPHPSINRVSFCIELIHRVKTTANSREEEIWYPSWWDSIARDIPMESTPLGSYLQQMKTAGLYLWGKAYSTPVIRHIGSEKSAIKDSFAIPCTRSYSFGKSSGVPDKVKRYLDKRK